MRSGTTVIHRALCTARNSNPYVSESWFIRDIMQLYRGTLPRYALRSADQFGAVQNFEQLIRMNMNYYTSLVSARYGDPEILIFKHPELIKQFVELGYLFPHMHFLGIVRDPRDVIASMKRIHDQQAADRITSPVSKLSGIEEMCSFYAGYYDVVLKVENRMKRLMLVRYEDVMRNPKEEIARIGAFSGADYDLEAGPAFNEGRAESNNLDKEFRLKDRVSSAFWSDLYTKDLSPERIGRFPEVLSPAEVGTVESRLQAIGRRFAYW